jgi:hypothetical protein
MDEKMKKQKVKDRRFPDERPKVRVFLIRLYNKQNKRFHVEVLYTQQPLSKELNKRRITDEVYAKLGRIDVKQIA